MKPPGALQFVTPLPFCVPSLKFSVEIQIPCLCFTHPARELRSTRDKSRCAETLSDVLHDVALFLFISNFAFVATFSLAAPFWNLRLLATCSLPSAKLYGQRLCSGLGCGREREGTPRP